LSCRAADAISEPAARAWRGESDVVVAPREQKARSLIVPPIVGARFPTLAACRMVWAAEGVAQGDQSVLPPAVRFEEVLILFVKPAINLNREFQVRECDVDVVEAALQNHRKVRLPASDRRPRRIRWARRSAADQGSFRESMSSLSRSWLPVRLGVRRRASYIPPRVAALVRSAISIASAHSKVARSMAVRAGAVHRRPARSMTSPAGM
jgi:hypothetical protein